MCLVHLSYTAWGTLHVHCSPGSVVAVYTAQSMQSMYSAHCSTLQLHCMYTALRSGMGVALKEAVGDVILLLSLF